VIGTVFGPYRIDTLLGRGGMGEVYRATDTTQDGRAVALKVLTPGLSGDPQFAARFRRESEIAARVAEPHVVPIHRYGEIDGRLFLDMQLVDGQELADVIERDRPLDPERAVAIIEQVGAALDAAHADGLVHRDVKPSNILLTQPGDGRPEFAYLVDFGIARATDPGSRTALTRTGAVVGTLAYMAPERFLARPAGPASDIYSLACVLHELITGVRPYPGTGYAVQVAGHVHQPPPQPSVLQPGLPAALDAVIARGMAKDPAARFPTAGDLVEAARAALAGAAPSPAGAQGDSAPAAPRGAPTVLDAPVAPTWVPGAGMPPPPVAAPPSWSPGERRSDPPPTRRKRRWVPVVAVAALIAAVLTTVLIVGRPTTGTEVAASPAGEPAPAGAPGDAVPSVAPITERTLVGRAATGLESPVIADFDGTPVLVTTGLGETLVLDMATGEPIGEPIDNGFTMAATATRLDGRSIVITGGSEQVIRLWDLGTGEPLPTTLAGHTGVITHLAVVDVDGRKVLVSGSGDQTVRRWDLATAAPIGEPLTVTGRVTGLSVIPSVDGAVVLARGAAPPPKSNEGAIQAWNIASGAPVGAPVATVDDTFSAVQLPGGTAVLGRVDYSRFKLVDLRSGAPVSGYTTSEVLDPIVAVVAGRPLLVESDIPTGTISLRDLRDGSSVGGELSGHEDLITSMAPVTVGDTTYLVSASADRSIRIWDLTARAGS
jgi:serine/threonine-protein kinase